MSYELSKVYLSTDVLHGCLIHAMSTEYQEIMGLLLGCIHSNSKTNAIEAHIERCFILSRKDRKKDRVEVSDEDLARSSTVAEDLCRMDMSKECRIIGWYHSHPHITILPSHVDVKTQGSYQALDIGFVGLIFSVFNLGKVEICAFQSLKIGQDWQRVEIPIEVISSDQLQKSPRHKFEYLVSSFLVHMNEEFSVLDNALIESNSSFEISRIMNAYQNSLLRLVDYQLKPLQLLLKSRIASLERKKAKLLEYNNSKVSNKDKSQLSGQSTFNIRQSIDILSLNIKFWWQAIITLKNSLEKGISITFLNIPDFQLKTHPTLQELQVYFNDNASKNMKIVPLHHSSQCWGLNFDSCFEIIWPILNIMHSEELDTICFRVIFPHSSSTNHMTGYTFLQRHHEDIPFELHIRLQQNDEDSSLAKYIQFATKMKLWDKS